MLSKGLVYITGIDGSGKSTLVNIIEKELCQRGIRSTTYWLRFNHVISKPLLGFCRLIGLTRYENIGGIRIGYHEFSKSRIISWLFIALQYLDALRVKYFKIFPASFKKNHIIILDRFVYDILIDMSVDTNIDLFSSRVYKCFTNLVPKNAKIILIDRDMDEVLKCRPEGVVDKYFKKRRVLFDRLKHENNIIVIENSRTIEEMREQVIDILEADS